MYTLLDWILISVQYTQVYPMTYRFQSQIAQLESSLKERSSELQTTTGQLEGAKNEILDLKSKLDLFTKDMEKLTLASKKLKV